MFHFQLGRDRSRGSSCRAIVPAIDRSEVFRPQANDVTWPSLVLRVRVWKSMKLGMHSV